MGISKMFSKTSAPISEKAYYISKPSMTVNRILALFPVAVYKEGDQTYLKWSPGYVVYSFLLGFILQFLTYRGLMEDIFVDREKSIRIKSRTDLYVVAADVSVVQIVVFYSIFIIAFNYSDFFAFLEHVHKVDLLLPINDGKSSRRASITVMCIVLGITFSMFTADTLMYFRTRGSESGRSAILKCYLPFYITYHIMLMSQFKFFQLASSVMRRLKLFNRELVTENFLKNIQTKSAGLTTGIEDKSFKFGEIIINDDGKAIYNHELIPNLSVAYGELCEAVNSLNKLMGFVNAITILDILWHLIETPYHLLSEMAGSRRDPAYITMMILWCFYHLSRLLILVEPCNECKLEVQKVKKFVQKLRSLNMINDQRIKNQLKLFATALSQNQLEFNAWGLARIDRTVITALVGMITTFLVILFEFRNN